MKMKKQFNIGDFLLVRNVNHIDGWWFKSTVDAVNGNELHFTNGETVVIDDRVEIIEADGVVYRRANTKKVFDLKKDDKHIGFFNTDKEMLGYINDLFAKTPEVSYEKFIGEFSFTESNKFVLEDA